MYYLIGKLCYLVKHKLIIDKQKTYNFYFINDISGKVHGQMTVINDNIAGLRVIFCHGIFNEVHESLREL